MNELCVKELCVKELCTQFSHTQLLHNSCCHTLTFLLCGRRGTCSPAVSGGAPWSALTPDTRGACVWQA